MSLEVEAYEGELKKLRRVWELIDHTLMAEKLGDRYFICGESGQHDQNGLPDKLYVSPSYGCDFFIVYEKTDSVGR